MPTLRHLCVFEVVVDILIIKGPVPLGGTPLKEIHVLPLAVTIIYYLFASAGIIFTLICFFFTVIFRNKR